MGRGGNNSDLASAVYSRSSLGKQETAPRWSERRLVTFDLETTGVDVEKDRIVTASISIVSPNGDIESHEWLVNPGVDIPQEATDVHGVSDSQAKQEGQDAAEAVAEITHFLAKSVNQGMPLVVYNARYDITLLDREAKRYGVEALHDQSDPQVIDPFVIDKAVDPFRSGSRKLTDTCQEYGIDFNPDDAHAADVDALNTAQLAKALCQRYPDINIGLEEIAEKQKQWAKQQAAGLSKHLTEKYGREINISPDWPLTKKSAEKKDSGI